jgi:hypothetical protein
MRFAFLAALLSLSGCVSEPVDEDRSVVGVLNKDLPPDAHCAQYVGQFCSQPVVENDPAKAVDLPPDETCLQYAGSRCVVPNEVLSVPAADY